MIGCILFFFKVNAIRLFFSFLLHVYFIVSSSFNIAYAEVNEPYNASLSINVGLLNKETINRFSGGYYQQLNDFAKLYWQDWSVKYKQNVEFVYLSEEQLVSELIEGRIDVIGAKQVPNEVDSDTLNNQENRFLYSIPYSKFTPVFFELLASNEHSNIQLALYSESQQRSSFFTSQSLSLINNKHDLLSQYKKYKTLYSEQPWLLAKRMAELDLTDEYYLNINNAPHLYFHFVTRSADRALMYKINEDLRGIKSHYFDNGMSETKEFIHGEFEIILGHYTNTLTEDEKQYVLDHNYVRYPMLTTGFPPYFIDRLQVQGYQKESTASLEKSGFLLDLLQHITNETGLIFQPYYVNSKLEGMELITNKTLDVTAIQNHSWQENKRYLNSNAYIYSEYSIIYRHQEPIRHSLSALKNQTIAVVNDFLVTEYLNKHLSQATFKAFNTVEEAIYAVATGKANAYVGEALNSAYIIKQAKLSNLTAIPLSEAEMNIEFGFAALQDNKALIKLLNRGISSVPRQQFYLSYELWSKMAFSNASAKKEVEVAYERALLVFIILVIITVFIIRFYIKQINFRELAQHNVEQALAVAEEAKVEAERSAQTKIDFLARMSHEIRTPMNGVLGMAESISFTQLSTKQKGLLGTLTDSAENLLELLNDLLDFAKMDAGKLVLESQSVNIKELVNQTFSAFTYIEKDKNIKLKLSIDKSLHHRYLTDSLRLTQVLNNLLSNAVKFTHQGYVHVSVLLESRTSENNQQYDTVKIVVKDSGIGINENHQKQLFSPFIQADSAVTRQFGGTGLGLSICQEIVNAMGSQINIKSSVDIGSEFFFHLVLKQVDGIPFIEDRRLMSRDVIARDETKFRDLRVLMAEDNVVNIKVLSAQLERLNIKPEIAENGQQAIEMFNKNEYDVVISDCHMPIVDGYELANTLSKQKEKNSPWLIAITAEALEGTAEKCFSAGFDDYIVKPCTQSIISDKIHHAYRKIMNHQDQEILSQPHREYQYFRPEVLFEHNDQDLVLCKKVAQLFLDTWQADKTLLIEALYKMDFHHLFALVHRLKGTTQYLANDSLESNALLIKKQAQGLQTESIRYSVKLFIREIDVLNEEVAEWLEQ